MKSPKIGIIILALVAIAVLVGGFAGWQIRQQGAVAPQAKAEAPAASKDLLRATYDPPPSSAAGIAMIPSCPATWTTASAPSCPSPTNRRS